jgi:hypothetical protein
MAHLIYVPQINPNTFLHATHRGQATCLRDYSVGPCAPPREDRRLTHAQLQQLVRLPGNVSVPGEAVPWERTDFWHRRVAELNRSRGLGGSPPAAAAGRLLDAFHAEAAPHLAAADADGLRAVLRRWANGFTRVVEKAEFNHWDRTDATPAIDSRTGIGWTASLLEHCRSGGRLRTVDAGGPGLDFSLLSMDLHLGISSADNPFRPGQRDFIKPDGLGVRPGGGWVVMEVKGPLDSQEPLRATVQALCGGLAVLARHEMLAGIARRPWGRRPAAEPGARGPDCLGLAVLLASPALPLDGPDFRAAADTILRASPAVRDISILAGDPGAAGFPARLPLAGLFRR